MADRSHLYLLVFPDRQLLKIGKADCVHSRCQDLRADWGDVDYSASYQLEAPESIVFGLERSLHFLLSEHSRAFDSGAGKTEFFGLEAIDRALKHIELFAPSKIVRGIPKPTRLTEKPATPTHAFRAYHRAVAGSENMAESVSRTAMQFLRIHRWLLVLLRRQNRIEYQYDLVDHAVHFRFRGRLISKLDVLAIHELFHFRVKNVKNGSGWCNSLTSYEIPGVLEFICELPTTDPESPVYHPVLSFFACQTERVLALLPRRSEAAKTDIPAIDLDEFRQARAAFTEAEE